MGRVVAIDRGLGTRHSGRRCCRTPAGPRATGTRAPPGKKAGG